MVFCLSSPNVLRQTAKSNCYSCTAPGLVLPTVVQYVTSPRSLASPLHRGLRSLGVTTIKVTALLALLSYPQKSLISTGNVSVTDLYKFKGRGNILHLFRWKMSINFQPLFNKCLTFTATGSTTTSASSSQNQFLYLHVSNCLLYY